MPSLASDLRRQLENVVVQACDLAETAARGVEAVGGRRGGAVRPLLEGGQRLSETTAARTDGKRAMRETKPKRRRRSTG